ncbi:Cytochrome oxidase assembly [Bacidia gigantensis]|uniref:Cytochrome oxidase assembly n=1 Tax=Bacidia gigantensis TaxID=2732470 RepID=UPI001D05162E|nr:Cytochrome oxidase assembly [Bacidia gigantensis]KAG8530067.1 Cytochrome oxidase assembly [Bacidia gigantensis]
MPPSPFPSRRLPTNPTTFFGRIGAWYRRNLDNHPFALFGLPFCAAIVAGSFALTPATALRYERHDRKMKQLSKEEALGLGKDRRKVDMQEEYYRLAAKDLDDWQQKRVPRLEGERDGKA